jgi:hypothetical protein
MGAEINQNLPDEIGHFGCWMLQCWEVFNSYMNMLDAMLGNRLLLHDCARVFIFG